MRARVRLSLCLAGLALYPAGCAVQPQAQPQAQGRLLVEVYRGMGGNAAGSFHPGIALLIDARESMGTPVSAQATRLAAAKRKGDELLAALPKGTPVSLYMLGGDAPEADCTPIERGAQLVMADAAELRAQLASLEPANAGSLAAALVGLTADLRDKGRVRDSRVVVLTDLHEDPRCGGDLCQAAARLVEAGAWLDVAVIGDAPAPACLAALRPAAASPGALVRALTHSPARWSLGAGSGADVVSSGAAGPLAFEAPAGEWELELELDRPLRIAPLEILPGRTTRVRVLDFPGAPPRYEWKVLDEQR
jgi:hypothetical protein